MMRCVRVSVCIYDDDDDVDDDDDDAEEPIVEEHKPKTDKNT